MNINRYALREERKIQKIISKMGPIDATAIGMCNENRITSNILMPFHDNHLPISVFVPKRKEWDRKKFPVIVDIYGGGFVAGRSEQNKHFGAWCAEHGYLTFIPEYSPGPETNLFGQIGDLLKSFAAINRYVDSYDGDKSRMYLGGDGAGAALACLTYSIIWNPVSMQHLEDELPFDVPQDAKLSFKAMCLQNGVFTFSKGKTGVIAPYIIDSDWKKTSYAECLSPKTYAKMLPPCFFVTSIADSQRGDTKRMSSFLRAKGTKQDMYSTSYLFTKENFAARYPNKPYSEAANLAMLKFFEKI